MKILHIGLASHFTEGMSYQDNCLSHQNALDGHEVVYISNASKYENGKLVKTGYEDKRLPDGVRLIRLPYVHVLHPFITEKVRKVKGLYTLLSHFSPDVIFCHALSFWSILDVIRYKKEHPEVKFYADTHTAAYNSGTNWLSLHVLHRIYYKWLVKKAVPYLEKYFYIGDAEKQFSVANYNVPESLMEFYPLGGVIPSEEEYTEKRVRRRTELNMAEGEILLVHSGKMDALKRTADLLRAFAAVPELNAKLAIIGSIPEDMKPVLDPLMAADSRVQYLGWKTGAELQEYLCACDLYCQPGSVSATLQNAICCNCALLSFPHEGYANTLNFGNFLWASSQSEIEDAFRSLLANKVNLAELAQESTRCARELLDYRALAARLYR